MMRKFPRARTARLSRVGPCIPVLLVLLSTLGCAVQLAKLREMPTDSGVAVTFDATLEETVSAARSALVEAGYTILEPVEDHGRGKVIYGELGFSMQSNGQNPVGLPAGRVASGATRPMTKAATPSGVTAF